MSKPPLEPHDDASFARYWYQRQQETQRKLDAIEAELEICKRKLALMRVRRPNATK